MHRRSLLWLGALSPIAIFSARYLSARSKAAARGFDVQGKALELNYLATNIRTETDAQRLVDFVSDLFCEDVPSAWRNGRLRTRMAEIEFAAVSDPQKLVSETRISEAWNAYVNRVGAPVERKATPAEIHNLRDALYISARLGWNRSYKNLWAVPSIYATQADGTLAAGCRAIESIRILWDLANMPDNLVAARERVRKSELFSDLIRASQGTAPTSTQESGVMAFRIMPPNPLQTATWRYMQTNGRKAWSHAVIAMVDQTLRAG